MNGRAVRGAAFWTLCVLAGCAQVAGGPPRAAPDARPVPLASEAALFQAVGRDPIVLLGEVHDNRDQHALRARALQRLFESGARPAIAFEQFDRDRQAAIDAARAADPSESLEHRARRMIEASGSRGWNWDLYQPYLVLALRYDVPIVAANLSRADAMRVATRGLDAVFSSAQITELGLDRRDAALEQAQEREIAEGHCGRLPAEALPAMAAAQIARDAVLAAAIAPYGERGVVLLTGNGHARRDIGVAQHLPATARARTVTIGLLEDDAHAAALASAFDVVLRTRAQERKDPCLDMHLPAMGS
jgi:uncharacterized iron-regulated protein